MTDVVYPLWSASPYKNRELRYSLRSVWKFGSNLGHPWIIGMQVPFLRGHYHLPIEPDAVCKDGKVAQCLLLACGCPEISDPFLFLCDDYFMLKPFDPLEIPYWYLNHKFESDNKLYDKACRGTVRFLENRGIENPKFFDAHVPVLIHKEKFKKCMTIDLKRAWFLCKSFYINQYPEFIPVKTHDCKIAGLRTEAWFNRHASFSTSDYLVPALWNRIVEMYPDPSPFERK